MMVLLIALIPALVVVVIAVMTYSMVWVTLTAIAMALLGVMTGDPAYSFVDVIFVVLGYLFANSIVKEHKKFSPPPPAPDPQKNSGKESSGFYWLAIILVVAYNIFDKKSTAPPPSSQANGPPINQELPLASTQQNEIVKNILPKRIAQKSIPKIPVHKPDLLKEEEIQAPTMQNLIDTCKPPTCRIVN